MGFLSVLLTCVCVCVRVHVCVCVCLRRLNNNDLSVLEATGAFKGLTQLKKM